ncbi:MAG: hypothetical protein K9G30_05540 [Parvibaculum sp.]|nr:hypothetical protein [Parvibaculum sp.]
MAAFVVFDGARSGVPVVAEGEHAGVAAHGSGDGEVAVMPGFDVLLASFNGAGEATLIALEGFLLTGGKGFREEWLDATHDLQSATDAIERQSSSWTDGHRLVQLVGIKRIVRQLLVEQSAVAAIVGTANRYPGLQLYTEGVRPALREARSICGDLLTAVLSVSSPDVVGLIDPVAKLRGDLGDLEDALNAYIGGGDTVEAPGAARHAEFLARIEVLRGIQSQAPAVLHPRIERLAHLLESSDEQLQRIVALRRGERWDYATYAFETRIVPLADRLKRITDEWQASS